MTAARIKGMKISKENNMKVVTVEKVCPTSSALTTKRFKMHEI